jgi:hypothetical protein
MADLDAIVVQSWDTVGRDSSLIEEVSLCAKDLTMEPEHLKRHEQEN